MQSRQHPGIASMEVIVTTTGDPRALAGLLHLLTPETPAAAVVPLREVRRARRR